MGFKLESLHLYRKVPRDLTDATSVGGAISVVCAMVMAYLFVSNISDYLKMQTTTDVALDDTGEVSMRIFFNITMVRRCACGSVASVRGARGRRKGDAPACATRGYELTGEGCGRACRCVWRLARQSSRLAAALRRGAGALRRSGCRASSPWWMSKTSWAPRSPT